MRRLGLGFVVLALAGCGSGSTRTVTVTTVTVRAPATGTQTTTSAQTTNTATGQTTASGPLPKLIAGSWAGIGPSTIYFSADGGNIVTDISWSSWTTTQAAGEGTSGIQSCVPNCAQGATKQVPTTITVSDPQDGHFTLLVEARNGRSDTVSYSSKASWPLGASGSG